MQSGRMNTTSRRARPVVDETQMAVIPTLVFSVPLVAMLLGLYIVQTPAPEGNGSDRLYACNLDVCYPMFVVCHDGRKTLCVDFASAADLLKNGSTPERCPG